MASDNILSRVGRVYIDKVHSNKTNKDYARLNVQFNLPNGHPYTYTALLNEEQNALISLASQPTDEPTNNNIGALE